ncbi:AMP-binding protein [Haloechinothrix sp. LS1_15]|uniref:AMP-binding protein n=1 Tax=Haloechinothrix sp. LS1_15 TaxID=2652248 RepID=UPI002946F38D|nr:AMP-binding protein [Haloechinothrix sp. LS1_15]MDV6014659.1 AMP-binding protein [Haloechinothrix sp. LS1_15]
MNAARDTASLLWHGARVLAGSGLAGQARPAALPRMARALREAGTSPATLVAVAAAHRPETTAVIDDRGSLDYAGIDEAGARLATGMAGHFGESRIRSVGVMCRNHRGFVIATLAAGRLGAGLLYLNTDFSAPQLAQVCERMRADVIVADEEFLPRLEGLGVGVIVAWQDSADNDLPSVDELVASNPRYRPARRVSSRPITLLTSGTTGAPKGAPRKPNPLATLGPVATLLQRSRLRAGDPVLIGPPLFHGFGIALWALAAFLRSPVVLRRRFDPETVLADTQAHRVACIAAVPAMLQRILGLDEATMARYDSTSLHTVLSGAAPLPPALATRFMDAFGEVLYNGYGSSEVGIATIATPAELRAAPGTVGTPSIGTPVRVLDAEGRPVPQGGSGTIFVGGPLVFSGYAGGGGKEMVDGLMTTGDVGYFDAAGRLHVQGRTDDMIISGGENVYPQEVEDVLTRHSAIVDAAVIGVDDEEFGQRLVAYVVPHRQWPGAAELAAYVKDNLARYKVPREFVEVDELPRNPTGKVLRTRLRDSGSG